MWNDRPWYQRRRWLVATSIVVGIAWWHAAQAAPGTGVPVAHEVSSTPSPAPVTDQGPGSSVLAAGATGPDGAGAVGPAATSGRSGPTRSGTAPNASTAGRPVAGGSVVPAAVSASQQEHVREHWDPATMETAVAAAPVVVERAPAATSTASAPSAPSTASAAAAAAAATAATSSTSSTSATTSAVSTVSTASGTATSSTAPTSSTNSAAPAPPSTVTADHGSAWAFGGEAARTSGRVFFTLSGIDYSCSGSAVDSPDGSTVLTAAHCVEGAKGFASRWAFVPGYDEGRAPYGVFAATHFAVLPGFAAGNVGEDFALVNVGPNAAGQTLGAAVGGQPISFAGTPSSGVDVLGYPMESPYDGSRLVHCAGQSTLDPRGTGDTGLTCAMTGGASGGPWLDGLDRTTGRGLLVSVTSFAYSDDLSVVYGPRLGDDAQRLFAAVGADPSA